MWQMKSEFLHVPARRAHSLSELVVDFQVVLEGIDRRLGYRGQARARLFGNDARVNHKIFGCQLNLQSTENVLRFIALRRNCFAAVATIAHLDQTIHTRRP
jgi:hypothetical protein